MPSGPIGPLAPMGPITIVPEVEPPIAGVDCSGATVSSTGSTVLSIPHPTAVQNVVICDSGPIGGVDCAGNPVNSTGTSVLSIPHPTAVQKVALCDPDSIKGSPTLYGLGTPRQIVTGVASASLALSTSGIKGVRVKARNASLYFTIANASATAATTSHWLAAGSIDEYAIDLTATPSPFIAAIQDSAPGSLQITELI